MLFCGPSVDAEFWIGQTYATSSSFHNASIGAGGYIVGMSLNSDGTMAARPNTYGAYSWQAGTKNPQTGTTGTWQQLLSPAAIANSLTTTQWLHDIIQGDGEAAFFELQIAPSNSTIWYGVFDGYVWKSTNAGVTWTKTGSTPTGSQMTSISAGGKWQNWGPKLAIHPTNPAVLYIGLPTGLYFTDDSGTTWTLVSTAQVPAPTSGYVTGIAFDPSTPSTVYANSNGNGTYQTTNASTSSAGTWSAISGGPSTNGVVSGKVTPTGGIYYALDGVNGSAGNLWGYNGSWTQVLSNSPDPVFAFAVDPSNASHLIAAGTVNAQFNETTSGDSASGWSGWTANATQSATGDIPWMTILSPYLAGAYLYFNPSNSHMLYSTGGNSFWTITWSGSITTGTTMTANSMGRGIEELVGTSVLAPPTATTNPVYGMEDHAAWYKTPSTLGLYQSTFGLNGNSTVIAIWDMSDCSTSATTLVANADGNYGGDGGEQSAISTDGGQTWTQFASTSYNPSTISGGTIACGTPNNIVIAKTNGTGTAPYYTTDGGASWHAISMTGPSGAVSWNHFCGASFYKAKCVAADKADATGMTFYLMLGGSDGNQGFYKSTNGGASWTFQSAGNSRGNLSDQNVKIRATPGQAGDIWWASGPSPSAGDNTLQHSTNGGANWTTITNASNAACIGFGAPAPGKSYPSVYYIGWYNVAGVTQTYGVWEADDIGTNAQGTWKQLLNVDGSAFPLDSLDIVTSCSGDPNMSGHVYLTFGGSGGAYYPYLLNRDLDPASNDNTPAYLDKVG